MTIKIPSKEEGCWQCIFYNNELYRCNLFDLVKHHNDNAKFEECIDEFGKNGGIYKLVKEKKK